jgi:uncharacterized protein
MEVRGTKLSSDEFYNKVLKTIHKPDFQYSWATGVAITKFLAGLKEGKIIGVTCDDCDRIVCPPRMFCEECFNPMNTYVELPDTGKINTFSLAFIRTDASRREKAEIPVVVDLDGTNIEPSGFLHLLDEDTDHSKIQVGSKIKAVWKDESERVGDITDIKYWQLMEENS